MLKLTMAALLSCVSGMSFAHGDLLEMTTLSVAEGLKQLKKDHPEHLAHFQGVKAWPVAAGIKLKIYLPDNATIGYSCVHQDLNPTESKIVCTMEM